MANSFVPRCPICGQVILEPEAATMPFCSQRCKQIDLGRWLGEEYRVASEPASDETDEEPPPA